MCEFVNYSNRVGLLLVGFYCIHSNRYNYPLCEFATNGMADFYILEDLEICRLVILVGHSIVKAFRGFSNRIPTSNKPTLF